MKRIVHAGCMVAVMALAGVPVTMAAAQSASPASPAPSGAAQSAHARREAWRADRQTIWNAELVGFKASLALTADQEKNWPAFEAALNKMEDAATAARPPMRMPQGHMSQGRMTQGHMGGGHMMAARATPPSPADVMRRMAGRFSRQASLLTSLADASTPLYASLDDRQKLIFRVTLRNMWRAGRHGRFMHHHRG